MRKIDDNKLIEMLNAGKSQKDIAEYFGCSNAAITKRKRKLQAALNVPNSFKELTDKEKKFVLAKVEGKTQTQAALESFECGSMESAKVIGSQLMQKEEIQKAVSELMHEEGLTKRYRVQVLKRHVDATDANISLRALDQSWKLDGAYTEVHEFRDTTAEYHEAKRELQDILLELAKRGLNMPNNIIDVKPIEAGTE